MARNDERRALLADAGIRVLAEEGARGLTHRAVDATAGVPRGTASNYFPSRDDLIAALVARISERLDPEAQPPLAVAAADHGALTAYLSDVVRRLRIDPHIPLALFELRLEAARRPSVAATLGSWRRGAFADDVDFHTQAGLPGGRFELLLLHYAIDGLMLDQLTVPLDPGQDDGPVIAALVDRLITD